MVAKDRIGVRRSARQLKPHLRESKTGETFPRLQESVEGGGMDLSKVRAGCAIFVSDRDGYPHHREHERHEHSSLETIQTAEGAAGKEMAGNQNSQVTEHLKG